MPIESYVLWEKVGKIALKLPEVYEKLCYDTPAFYTGKNFFVRLKEDGETIVVYNPERDNWIATNPDVFYFTDHYKNYPTLLLVDLKGVTTKELSQLIITSWKARATKKLLLAYVS